MNFDRLFSRLRDPSGLRRRLFCVLNSFVVLNCFAILNWLVMRTATKKPAVSVHLICRALLRVIQSLKDAASDVRLHSTLFFSLIGKLSWTLPLLMSPHMFRVLPMVYHGFETVGSEHQWAAFLCLLMGFDVYAIAHKGYWSQIIGLLLGAFIWFFFSSFVSQNLPHAFLGLPGTPGGYVYLFGGAGCFVGLFRTARRHRAEAEADNWILLTREFEQAQKRGELWAQPKKQKAPVKTLGG